MNIWALFGAVAAGLLFACVQWMQRGQAQATGGQLEAAKVTAVTATAQTAIAQAEAVAPTTQLAVVDRLKAGTF